MGEEKGGREGEGGGGRWLQIQSFVGCAVRDC